MHKTIGEVLDVELAKKLAGQERGKKMIADAVRQARKARAANKPTADMKPRVSDSAEGSATAASLVSSGDQTVTPPATPLKASTKPQPPLPIVLAPGLSGLLPQNRVVVHELAINREYRIPADEYCEHRATFQQPLFEGMRAELHSNESEAGFMYFATMMRYFKESLQRLTVKDSTDDASAEPYRESIKDNQVKLIVRIKKLAGQERGKKMIADAVRQARKARAANKPTADMKPRVSDSAEGSATAASLVSSG
ncbi:hypothetical protein BN1723_016573, partial [Verticillium longisporum]